MGKKRTSQHTVNDEIANIQENIKNRISTITERINTINNQLIALESILDDLNKKIHTNVDPKSSKFVDKSRYIRWYIEDIKVYNELNEIRINYEELLRKYYDQLITSNIKLEELRIKLAKIESENTQLQELYEQLEQKIQAALDNKNVEIKISNEYDDKYSL